MLNISISLGRRSVVLEVAGRFVAVDFAQHEAEWGRVAVNEAEQVTARAARRP